MDDLLREIADEVTLDDAHASDQIDPIESRLKKLRGDNEDDDRKEKNDNDEIDPQDYLGGDAGKSTAGKDNNADVSKDPDAASRKPGDEDLEAMQRLMAQTAAEVEEEAKRELKQLAADEEVRRRLEELRRFKKEEKEKKREEANEVSAQDKNEEDEEADEKEEERVIRQLLEEARMEEEEEEKAGFGGQTVRPSGDGKLERIDLVKPIVTMGRQIARAENAVDGSQQLPW